MMMSFATCQQYLLVDPTTAPLIPEFVGAPRLQSLRQKRVGIIDDNKGNAKELLEEIVTLLRQHFGVAEIHCHRKPSSSKPATPEVIHALAQSCDYVLVAIGS
jgi:hypothetical protein